MTALFDTQIDPDFKDMMISSQNLVHRMSVVFSYKEKIEIRRRRDVRRIREIISDRSLEDPRKTLRNHINMMSLYYDVEKVLIQEKESVARTTIRNWGKQGGIGSIASRVMRKDNFALSLVRCYQTALDVLDHHMERIRRYLTTLPNDEFTHPVEEVLVMYKEIRNHIEEHLIPTLKIQERHLQNFSIRLSLDDYISFMESYRRELKQNKEMMEKAKLKVNYLLQKRKDLSRRVRKYLEFKQRHQLAFGMFGLASFAVCILGGLFAAPVIFFGLFKATNMTFSFLSTAQGFLDSSSDIASVVWS
ncbi:hypothetical protein JW826_01620 [Candidatus Woesearchaeota archaeon]|nr:hypothetical protein [Candidatus Woesearchaeota archaeon]